MCVCVCEVVCCCDIGREGCCRGRNGRKVVEGVRKEADEESKKKGRKEEH